MTYRAFFKKLLGKYWFVYELCYFVLGVLVIAVVGSAAGEIVSVHLGVDHNFGSVTLMALVCVLVAWGTKLVETILSGWSFLLYATYGAFVYLYLNEYGGNLDTMLFEGEAKSDWFINAIRYVGYNVAAIPLILFCVAHMKSRNDSFIAGLLTGPLAMIPAVLFYLTIVVSPESILDVAVPSDFMMERLNSPLMQAIFYVVLFGTFVETCTAFIHAINERISEVYVERKERVMPKRLRVMTAVVILVISIYLAGSVGLVNLIGGGYGTLTWIFIAVYIVPLFSWGLYSIVRYDKKGMRIEEAS
ncbi:hypothetical protein JCM19233_1997 [Vibrio astriarenae]|nr:hypothetical protein JCM19233_1997 [Vibrio sp. C7]